MAQELPPERAARMRAREFNAADAFGVHDRNRQRVAECQRGGGTRGRCEIQRAGFFFRTRVEMRVGLLREARTRLARECDEFRAAPLDQGNDREQLVRFAGIGQRDKNVVARHHAQVAVTRFGRMNEIGGRAGARHG